MANYRPTLSKKWTASRVISVQDALDMGKIMFSSNALGKDAVLSYLDFDEALALCNTIINGSFSIAHPANENQAGITVTGKFTKYGGTKSSSRYNGGAESRILEVIAGVQEGTPKWAITIRNSEGTVDPTKGMITPKQGANVVSQRVYFTHDEIIKMMSKIKLHLESYYYNNMNNLYDENGEWTSERRTDSFTTDSAKNYQKDQDNEGGTKSINL